ncbi:MAG: CRISPR-associated endonuclease Cas3'' [Candidatus Sulfopaludibacter sp.]|nr:CRISPR-associated endonuclease Cas3'' [Candidatus Sulfopaludibacter sp.]
MKDAPRDQWHLLQRHLEDSAALAEEFASGFAPGWGRIAGLWHDAGKYQRAFQGRIGADPDAHCDARVDHSTVGALIARNRGAHPLCFLIAGHHGGIANKQELANRMERQSHLLAETRRDGLPRGLEEEILPPIPSWIGTDARKLALWTRFLFSALTDADFLDTERFYKGQLRDLGETMLLEALRDRIDAHLDAISTRATKVNAMRARVLADCRTAAELPPGAFTLTVPTGGGKTLASLCFGLRHAVKHGLRRVIVVIPYTSIIEQTTDTYREVLGEDAVIEHHSNLDPDRETRRNRLASENWDAPLVVTTSVQFFESLYANRPAKCRKLHRIAEAVVILDEVQTFPANLLQPIESALAQLVAHYRTTVVLCTATMPVLLNQLPAPPREIIKDVRGEFASVAGRCEVILPSSAKATTWEVLASELQRHESVLAIVHRRADAEALARILGDDCFHLSARMCGAHRREVLAEVKTRLKSGRPCRLVATQLVEAGVDVDFPEVYRAMGGADSLAQAAGRCNREGSRNRGYLHVFVAPTEPPRGILRTAKETTWVLWNQGRLDLSDADLFQEYFRRLYGMVETDAGVIAAEKELRFRDSADNFRMIDDSGIAVVAPYRGSDERIADVRHNITRLGMRRLQPYLVSLYPQEIDQLNRAGALDPLDDHLFAVSPPFVSLYHPRFGFTWQAHPLAEPRQLII